jgi:hypothetical protein
LEPATFDQKSWLEDSTVAAGLQECLEAELRLSYDTEAAPLNPALRELMKSIPDPRDAPASTKLCLLRCDHRSANSRNHALP